MKTLALCLVCLVGLAFAGVSQFEAATPTGSGHGGPGTDGEIFNQQYAFAYLLNGFHHGYMCDDFEVSSDASLDTVVAWMIYNPEPCPTEYNMAILEDSGLTDPNFATSVWTGTCSASAVDTGDDNWGFNIWEMTLVCPSAYTLTSGQLYWLSMQFSETITDYWLVQDPVWGDYAWTGTDGILWTRVDDPNTFDTPADAFFNLYSSSGALDNETWGAIKGIF